LAKFRGGTAAVGIKLGRYDRLQVEQGLCCHCKKKLKMKHMLFFFTLSTYDSVRLVLLQSEKYTLQWF
jgi:hypothetical protein